MVHVPNRRKTSFGDADNRPTSRPNSHPPDAFLATNRLPRVTPFGLHPRLRSSASLRHRFFQKPLATNLISHRFNRLKPINTAALCKSVYKQFICGNRCLNNHQQSVLKERTPEQSEWLVAEGEAQRNPR